MDTMIELDYRCGHKARAYEGSVGHREYRYGSLCAKCTIAHRQELGLPVYTHWTTACKILAGQAEILSQVTVWESSSVCVTLITARKPNGELVYALEGAVAVLDDVVYYYTRMPRLTSLISLIRLLIYMRVPREIIGRHLLVGCGHEIA